MNEAKAEAVLRALAESLVWQDEGKRSDGTCGKVLYYVWPLYAPDEIVTVESPTAGYQAVLVLPSGLFAGDCLHHDTMEEAKACCERHHATGVWE